MSAPVPVIAVSPIEKCRIEQRKAAELLLTGGDKKQACLWMSDWLAEELIIDGSWGTEF